MERIEKNQWQATLPITGSWQGSNRNILYEELGWKSLTDGRWLRRLIQFHKICKGLVPKYLCDILLPLRRPLYGHQNSSNYLQIACNKTRFMNSF